MLFYSFQSFDSNCVISCNDTSNFCVSVHMNPVATHEYSGEIRKKKRVNRYTNNEKINYDVEKLFKKKHL